MNDESFRAVDAYLAGKLLKADPALEAALTANRAAGLPAIDVSPLQGRMLQLFARMAGARRILEIGTLGGYSTISLARALPRDGKLISLEAVAAHATVARANLERAGVAGLVEIRVGRALDTLPLLLKERAGPFDLVFIDADKESNAEYLGWAVKLSRPGTVIVCDNIGREGRIVDPETKDPKVRGTQRFFDAAAAEPRLTATAVQTVGEKGWDGFALAVVD
ncbi:MAG: O-methyltransferase [Bauldia sp.]